MERELKSDLGHDTLWYCVEIQKIFYLHWSLIGYIQYNDLYKEYILNLK